MVLLSETVQPQQNKHTVGKRMKRARKWQKLLASWDKKNIPPVLIPRAEVRLSTERINNGASLSRVLSPLHMMASCVWGSPPAPTGCKNTWSLYLSKHWYSPVNTILEIVGERHKLWHLRMSPGLSWPVLVLVYIYSCQWSNNFGLTCSGFISLLPYRVKWQAQVVTA